MVGGRKKLFVKVSFDLSIRGSTTVCVYVRDWLQNVLTLPAICLSAEGRVPDGCTVSTCLFLPCAWQNTRGTDWLQLGVLAPLHGLVDVQMLLLLWVLLMLIFGTNSVHASL